eukprot:TRINITY_DN16899_c0_g1_i1.p1 TRINITY_DN16899_c0_g1~~TRINITY_DN16899_c0_g1_i1.p1  ORF type:complete len:391 (-),score=118.29 TRINITY_DN16899_c0_g1_i1:142-1314(-)
MLSRAWQWACRNKWAIGAATAAAGGVVLYSGYHVLQQQERWIRERKLAQHREQMIDVSLENSMELCVGALSDIMLVLQDGMPVPTADELRDATRNQDREEKVRMWVSVIVAAFTRLIAGAYTTCLYSLLTRAQVVLLSRYMILHVHERSEQNTTDGSELDAANFVYAIEKHTQRSFMHASEYIKKGAGMQQLLMHVKREVEDLIQSQSIAKKCTHAEIVQMIDRVRQRLERAASESSESAASAGAPTNSATSPLVQFLLPPENDYDHMLDGMHDRQFDALLNELRNLFDTVEFNQVLESTLDTCFKRVYGELRSMFDAPRGASAADASEEAPPEEAGQRAVPLVQISSSLKKHANALVTADHGRVYLEGMFRSPGAAQWMEAVLNTGLPH